MLKKHQKDRSDVFLFLNGKSGPVNGWVPTGPEDRLEKRPGPPKKPKNFRARWKVTVGPGDDLPPATNAAPTVAQMAAVTSRMDRQEAMFEAVLERLAAVLPAPETTSVEQGGSGTQGLAALAGAPVMQLAPVDTPPAPLIIGGVQPEGYLYEGANAGISIWGLAELVAASVTDEAGNAAGM